MSASQTWYLILMELLFRSSRMMWLMPVNYTWKLLKIQRQLTAVDEFLVFLEDLVRIHTRHPEVSEGDVIQLTAASARSLEAAERIVDPFAAENAASKTNRPQIMFLIIH